MPVETYQSLILGTSGLAGYWRLGETSGTTAADSSGNGHTLTQAYTAPTWGVAGGIVDADTAARHESGIFRRYDTPGLQPTSGVTIIGWVKPVGVSGSQAIYNCLDAMGGYQSGYGLRLVNDALELFIRIGGGYAVLTSGPAATAGAWQMVSATYSGIRMAVQVNAVEAAGQSQSGEITYTNPVEHSIGGYDAGVIGHPLNGDLDEVSVFNRALSDAELLAIYTRGISGPSQPPATGQHYAFPGMGFGLLGD